MEFIMKIWGWAMSEGSLYFLVLFLMSEALGMIPSIRASSVFQLVAGALKYLKDKFPKR